MGRLIYQTQGIQLNVCVTYQEFFYAQIPKSRRFSINVFYAYTTIWPEHACNCQYIPQCLWTINPEIM